MSATQGNTTRRPGLRITFWNTVATLILVTAAVAIVQRFTQGLGRTTHMNDAFPWGLWIGFDMLCGVGLAAGGFTLAATVHIFHVKRFEPIVRPAILTAFLGYILAICGLMCDLGRPLNIWHAIIMWNPRSVMFEVAWCVMLYTTVLFLEFLPVVLERFKFKPALRALRTVSLPIIILGVLLSTLHQSSLGSLYLIVPQKLYPLWYTPYLPLLFFVSAVSVGLSMIILESCLSCRAFGRGLEMDLLADIGRLSVVALAVLGTLRLVDLAMRGQLGLLLVPRGETWLFWAELLIGIFVPLSLYAQKRIRESRAGLFVAALFVVLGFIVDRLNVSVTGLEAYAGRHYFPSWQEIMGTAGLVTAGFVAFAFAVRWFPVFEHEEPRAQAETGTALREALARDLSLASQEN